MKGKKIIATLMIIILGIFLLQTNVNAAMFQSIKRVNFIQKSATDWATQIRNMESTGGGMALSEMINDDLTPQGSNNIDVHLQKNTEYGAILLLGASQYGKQGRNVANDITSRYMQYGTVNGSMEHEATTTGNATGIYELGYGIISSGTYNDMNNGTMEATAGGGEGYLSNVNAKYRDIYKEAVAKTGDAVKEGDTWIARWQLSAGSDMFTNFIPTGNSGFQRGYASTNSSYGSKQAGPFTFRNAVRTDASTSRACVVVGNGF